MCVIFNTVMVIKSHLLCCRMSLMAWSYSTCSMCAPTPMAMAWLSAKHTVMSSRQMPVTSYLTYFQNQDLDEDEARGSVTPYIPYATLSHNKVSAKDCSFCMNINLVASKCDYINQTFHSLN